MVPFQKLNNKSFVIPFHRSVCNPHDFALPLLHGMKSSKHASTQKILEVRENCKIKHKGLLIFQCPLPLPLPLPIHISCTFSQAYRNGRQLLLLIRGLLAIMPQPVYGWPCDLSVKAEFFSLVRSVCSGTFTGNV